MNNRESIQERIDFLLMEAERFDRIKCQLCAKYRRKEVEKLKRRLNGI